MSEAAVDASRAVETAVPARFVEWSADAGRFVIEAPADGWVFIDRAWWPSWQTFVDGRAVAVHRAWGGQLIPVPAGRHVVDQRLWPWEALVGLLAGFVALLVALRWARILPRRRRPQYETNPATFTAQTP